MNVVARYVQGQMRMYDGVVFKGSLLLSHTLKSESLIRFYILLRASKYFYAVSATDIRSISAELPCRG